MFPAPAPGPLSPARRRQIQERLGESHIDCQSEWDLRDLLAELARRDALVQAPEVKALVKRLRDARPSHSAECDREPFNAPCVCGFREARDVCKQAADLLDSLMEAT
jgi:hypothetical protein